LSCHNRKSITKQQNGKLKQVHNPQTVHVIGHGIGGKDILIKMAQPQLANSQLLEPATTVCHHPISQPLNE
jgi:hypothetical protein